MTALVFAELADLLSDVRRPVLVAVDGPDGGGKTEFARALVAQLDTRGVPVEHSSVDCFHHPRAHRHALGRTPEAIWTRHFDYRAMRRELLDPWRRGPGAAYTPVWHDVERDEFVEPAECVVPERGVLVVDGVFLQRPELAALWDLTIYLDVPPEVTVARMARRDGTPDDLGHPDQQRYLRAQERYRATCDPIELADVVVDNSDWTAPVVRAASPVPHWRREGDEIVREVRLPASAHDRASAIDRLAAPGP